jgi:hypothetical protein
MPASDGLPDFRPGRLRAADLAALVKAFRRSRIQVAPGSPLKVEQGANADIISYTGPRPILAKILGGTNPYSWQQIVRTGSISTANGPLSGTTSTDPAYELSGFNQVPVNSIVRMIRDPQTGQWNFPWCY